jgi:phosphotransferase system  glucose/maltose/N-acetylglucosamine-specific IIC component
LEETNAEVINRDKFEKQKPYFSPSGQIIVACVIWQIYLLHMKFAVGHDLPWLTVFMPVVLYASFIGIFCATIVLITALFVLMNRILSKNQA